MTSKSKQRDNIEKLESLKTLIKQLSSDSNLKLQQQVVRKIQSVLDINSVHRDEEIQLILSSGSLRKLVSILKEDNRSTSLLNETLHLLITLTKGQTGSAVAEVLVDYDCISALLEIIQKTRHDSLAADAKKLLFQLLEGPPHPTLDKMEKLNQSHNKDPPKKIKGQNEKPQSTEKSTEIIPQDSVCNPNPKFLTQGDIRTFQKLCNWVKNSSTPKTVLLGLEGLRTIVYRLPEDNNSYFPSLINKEAVPVLTLLMKRFSNIDFVRYEAKAVLMALIPKLRPYDTPSSVGMMVRVPFVPLLQRENETLVVDALELLQKYSQSGVAHIDALLDSRIVGKVVQWQFDKVYSDRRRKCWCEKIKKLMAEIIWEIVTRGSDRQVSTLIEENPVLVRAFASILMDSQGETPSCDNAHALDKAFDVLLIVTKKLSQWSNKGQLRSFVSLVKTTGTKSCLIQCKGNSHLERHQKSIRKVLRFLRKSQ